MRKFKNLSCILSVAQCFWAANGAEPTDAYKKLREMPCFLMGAEPGRLLIYPSKALAKLVRKFSRTLTKDGYTQIEKGLKSELDGSRFVYVWYLLITIDSEDSKRVAESAREKLIKDERRVFKGFPGRKTILNSTRDPEEWLRNNAKWFPELEQ